MPDVVDADADGHKGGLAINHVLFESFDQIFRLLSADADVDDLRNFQIGILLVEEGVHVTEVSATLRDRVADADDLLAGLDLKFSGRIRRRGTDQRQDHGKQLGDDKIHEPCSLS